MADTAQQFGSLHTERKLRAVASYLSAYTTALKRQSFELIYVDACAGSGSSKAREKSGQPKLIEADEITIGSAIRALQIFTPFDRYILNDTKRKNVKSLEAIVREQFPKLADRVSVVHSDANLALRDLCLSTNWQKSRAVVFLDPFGLQIKYDVVAELAATNAVDLWYLVPVLGMSRQIKNDGSVLESGGIRIDDVLGSSTWRQAATTTIDGATDLFGELEPSVQKIANASWFEKVAIDKLKLIFKGGVLPQALPLGRGGLHEFSLVFACANPSSAANKLAIRLAAAVLK